jgi:hypothetical protein
MMTVTMMGMMEGIPIASSMISAVGMTLMAVTLSELGKVLAQAR